MATKVKLISETITPTLAGGTLTGDLNFGDSDKAVFGAGTDFEIYSDGGSNNYLISNNGALILRNLGDDKDIYLQSDDGSGGFTSYIHAKGSTGEVILKHYGSNKITTSSTGATVTGNLAVTGDLDITGNVNSASVTDLDVTDKTITLGAGQTEALSGGSGIIVDGSNASILWDETNTEWDFNNSINVTGTLTLADIASSGYLQLTANDVDFIVRDTTDSPTNFIWRDHSGSKLYLGSPAAEVTIRSDAIIDTGYKIGIGTDSPDALLHLSGGAGEKIIIEHATAPRGNYIGMSSSDNLEIAADEDNLGGDSSIRFRVDADEKVRIRHDGKVDIGNSTALYGKLTVTQSSGADTDEGGIGIVDSTNGRSMRLYCSSTTSFINSGNGGGQNLVLNEDGGNVGIGTSSPSADLHIGRTSGAAVLKVDTTATADAGIQIKGYDAYVALGDNTNGLQWYVWNDGPSSSSSLKFGSQALSASDWYADASQAMVITSSGKVGIGETSPDSTLHVKGTSQLNLLTIERTSSTPGIKFVSGADTAGTFGFQLMDNNEWWVGTYDGSNYDYWIQSNLDALRVEKQISSFTDSGTKQYSHLCTGSFYQSTGAIVIETNIPAHNASGNANMLSIKIRGFEYAIHGSIDLNVGCYAGEGQYYSANYNSNYIAEGWRGNLKFAKNDTTGKMAIILGTTSTVQRCELAVVDFIQGFQNVNESYANGWSMSLKTSLSNYSQQTDMAPRVQSPRPGFHAYLDSNTSFTAGTAARLLTQTTFNEGSHYNTSNGRFTAPTEGVYQFNFAFQGQSTSVNQTYLSAEARVNGSTRYIGGWFNKTTGGNNGTNTYSAATGSALIKLSRNDYVEFVCELSNTDSALGGNPGYTYFSGILVG